MVPTSCHACGRSTAGCSKFSDSVSLASTSKRPSPPVATNRLAAREKTWLVFDLIRRTVPATNTGAMASTMRIPRQSDLGRLTCFATAGGPPCSPAQWLALRSGSSGEWAGYSHSCLCAVGHQDLFCCRVYPVGRRHSILSSDRLAFDHFKITLIVMVTTATGNRADLHEFLACRRFQSKWDHLQVLVSVAGRRRHWGDLPSALYVDWLSRSKTGPQKRVTKVTNRRSSSACCGSQVYDGFGKRKLGPAQFVRSDRRCRHRALDKTSRAPVRPPFSASHSVARSARCLGPDIRPKPRRFIRMSGLATSGASRLDVARARWLLSYCTVNCRLTPRTPRTVPVSRPVQSIEPSRMRVGPLRGCGPLVCQTREGFMWHRPRTTSAPPAIWPTL